MQARLGAFSLRDAEDPAEEPADPGEPAEEEAEAVGRRASRILAASMAQEGRSLPKGHQHQILSAMSDFSVELWQRIIC